MCKVAPNCIGILTNLRTFKNTFHFIFPQSAMSYHLHKLGYSIGLRCPNKLLHVGCTQVCFKCFNGDLHTFFTMCIESSKWWMNNFGQYSKVWNAKNVPEKLPQLVPLTLGFPTYVSNEFQLPSSVRLPTHMLLFVMVVGNFLQGHSINDLIHFEMDDPLIRIFCVHQ